MGSSTPRAPGGPGLLSLLLAPFAILLVWALLSLALDSPVIPGPVAVLTTFAELLPEIGAHMGVSLLRVLASLTLATVSALPLGILLGRSPWARRTLTPLVYLLYPVPKIALLPLVFLLVGVGEGARILLLWLVLFFQILLGVRDAAAAVPKGYDHSLLLLGGGKGAYLRFVLLPSILPALLTSLRIGSATALAVLFFAETFFTNRGLGIFIVDGWMRASYDEMLAGVVAIGLVGVVLFALLDGAERYLCRWRR